jgi:hypothetical protein
VRNASGEEEIDRMGEIMMMMVIVIIIIDTQ